MDAEYRHKHATLSGDRFPIGSKQDALDALRLRGHTKSKAERRAVIRKAARYAPKAAAAALKADQAKGLV